MDLTSRPSSYFSAQRMQLLQNRIREKGLVKDDVPPPIAPQVRPELLPLSFAQQRLWFIDQLLSENALYNVPIVRRLSGKLDIALLQKSFTEVVRRHEVLRTAFTLIDGSPIQVIAPEVTIALPVSNIAHCSEEERQGYIQDELMVPFALDSTPLLRARLFLLAPADHILVVTIHHIAFDGWSAGVLFDELSALYTAFCAGRASPLPPLPLQYADYALWQRNWLSDKILENQLAYWRKQLAHAPTHLQLPLDRPRPALPTFHGTLQSFTLPETLASSLKQVSREYEVTLFMLLLTAFQLLLARYSGQEDIVVGSLVANRTQPAVEKLIGFFVNTLVLRGDFSGHPTFSEALKRTRDVCLDAYVHQDLPFEKLVEEIQPERTLYNQPLFQILFQLENTPGEALQLPGIDVVSLTYKGQVARFDLACFVREMPSGLRVTFEYSTELFESTTIARMFQHFQTLLTHVVHDPTMMIWHYPLLEKPDIQQLLVAWNDTHKDYARDVCIQELFERQVDQTPAAIAIDFDGRQMTYQELNRQANQIAYYLMERGVRRGVPVAVCMDRSLEMVPALLAVLKAGGFYIPMEPSFPLARLNWLLSSLHISVLLTQASVFSLIPTDLPALQSILCLDEAFSPFSNNREEGEKEIKFRHELSSFTTENPVPQATADDLAYVIFTSGSTGTPKGVMVQHRPVVNLIEWVNNTYKIGAQDRVLFVASFCFDLSVYDIFGLLAVGGSIRVVSTEDLHDPEKLLQVLCREPITYWDSAPAFLQQLVPYFSSEVYRRDAQQSKLRLVFLSGDWIPLTLLDQVRALFPRALCTGLGGATEATIWSNYFPIEKIAANWLSIPYGRPIQNACYYILDPYLAPCPIGVTGDLYIGGECLSFGYIHEAILTAQKFIPDPFSGRSGMRLYRTGDQARFWPDGNIEFLGRVDTQVKIRGFRIEPGEIEATLLTHEAIQAVVVTAYGQNKYEKQLVAYIVFEPEKKASTQELRLFLQQQLPEYMVPQFFIPLVTFPLTGNGKIDWHALPDPGQMPMDSNAEYVAPNGFIEETIANAWQEALHLARVDVHSNFFDVGGDSIRCIQVIARVAQSALRITVPQMFQYQTIAELATVVEPIHHETSRGMLTGNVPLTPIQHWFFKQEFVNPHYFNQSFLFKTTRQLDPERIRQTIWQLLAHHDGLRLRFCLTAAGWRQSYAPIEDIPFEYLPLPASNEQESIEQIQATARRLQASLHLTNGPLIRVALLESGQTSRLLIVAHHLVIDIVSWQIVLDDFQRIYSQLSAGEMVRLPAKSTSYRDWAERLARYSLSRGVLEERSYWSAYAGRPMARLVQDHRSGKNLVSSTDIVTAELSEEETIVLQRKSLRIYQAHIDEIVLAVLGKICVQWAGQPHLVFHVERHGREALFNDIDVSRTVGWFTNMLPVVMSGETHGGLVGTLRDVQRQLTEAPDRGLGFGMLYYLGATPEIKEQLRPLSQADIVFNYLGQRDQREDHSVLLRPDPMKLGLASDEQNLLPYLFEINAWIADHQFHMRWSYSKQCYREATITSLVRKCMQELALVIHQIE